MIFDKYIYIYIYWILQRSDQEDKEEHNRAQWRKSTKANDGMDLSEHLVGQNGFTAYKVVKPIDSSSPLLFAGPPPCCPPTHLSKLYKLSDSFFIHHLGFYPPIAAAGTDHNGAEPESFEVVIFYRLVERSSSNGPYIVTRLHRAVISDYQLTSDGLHKTHLLYSAFSECLISFLLFVSVACIDGQMGGNSRLEELRFDYGKVSFSYLEDIVGMCTSLGCPTNGTSALNCPFLQRYNFAVDPVPQCP